MTQTKIWWGVAGLCLAAFLAAGLFAARINQHLPHSEDEAAYLFQAQVFAQNRLTVPTPPLADAFWSPFVVDYRGQRFGKYPPGWPLLLSTAVRVGQPWLANALLGGAALALMAGLAHLFYCPAESVCPLPLLAAALTLVTPAFLFQSGSLLSHPASLVWMMLALASLAGVGKRPAAAVLTGASLGAAFLTRPVSALAVGVVVVVFLLALILRGETRPRALGWLALGGLPVAALLPLFAWRVGGSPLFNAYTLVWPYDRLGFGPDIGPQGYSLHAAIFVNTRLKLSMLAGGLFGWPGWSNLIFLPVPFLARRANRWDWLLLAVIAAIVGVHIFYWAFGGADGGLPRYYYAALPAFVLLTARGIVMVSQILGEWRPALRLLPPALVALLVLFNLMWNLPPLVMAQQGKYNITPAPLEAVTQANLPEPALVLVQNVQSWSDFAAPFAANRPTLDGPVLYAIAWNPELARQLQRHYANRHCRQLDGAKLTPCPSVEAAQ